MQYKHKWKLLYYCGLPIMRILGTAARRLHSVKPSFWKLNLQNLPLFPSLIVCALGKRFNIALDLLLDLSLAQLDLTVFVAHVVLYIKLNLTFLFSRAFLHYEFLFMCFQMFLVKYVKFPSNKHILVLKPNYFQIFMFVSIIWLEFYKQRNFLIN